MASISSLHPNNIFMSLLTLFRKKRQARREHKAQKLKARDNERQTTGLLRIALKNNNSVNSFTAADPGVFYQRREDHEEWRARAAEGGGKRWDANKMEKLVNA